jgi:hypothetical protein
MSYREDACLNTDSAGAKQHHSATACHNANSTHDVPAILYTHWKTIEQAQSAEMLSSHVDSRKICFKPLSSCIPKGSEDERCVPGKTRQCCRADLLLIVILAMQQFKAYEISFDNDMLNIFQNWLLAPLRSIQTGAMVLLSAGLDV